MLMKLTHGNEAPLLMANEEEEGFDLNVDSLQKSGLRKMRREKYFESFAHSVSYFFFFFFFKSVF